MFLLPELSPIYSPCPQSGNKSISTLFPTDGCLLYLYCNLEPYLHVWRWRWALLAWCNISMGTEMFSSIWKGAFVLNSELRDKEEPVIDMLMGANQAGRRCGKYQSNCSWRRTWTVSLGRQSRRHQRVKHMTSVHPDRAQMTNVRHALWETDHEKRVN